MRVTKRFLTLANVIEVLREISRRIRRLNVRKSLISLIEGSQRFFRLVLRRLDVFSRRLGDQLSGLARQIVAFQNGFPSTIPHLLGGELSLRRGVRRSAGPVRQACSALRSPLPFGSQPPSREHRSAPARQCALFHRHPAAFLRHPRAALEYQHAAHRFHQQEDSSLPHRAFLWSRQPL